MILVTLATWEPFPHTRFPVGATTVQTEKALSPV